MNLFTKNKRKFTEDKESKFRGFTLIETLVAIFIMSVVVTGPAAFAQSGLRAAFVARDQVTAFYLAQDAIETIKNERDNNVLQGEDWLKGFDNCVNGNSDHACSIDTSSSSISTTDCGNDDCPALKFNEDTKKFEYGGSSADSKYIRNIYMNETENGREAQIVVEVKWTSNFLSSDRRIIVQENIFNWLDNS